MRALTSIFNLKIEFNLHFFGLNFKSNVNYE